MKKTDSSAETAAEVPSGWRSDRVLWFIIALAAFWGLVYNFVILSGLGPDELRHMNYVKLLVDEHRLPFLITQDKEYAGAHGYHPPLYYVCAIPFFVVGRALSGEGSVHLMRLFSMGLCLAALPFVYEIALAAGRDRNVARFATAIFASLPIFGMFMGVVNNDSATLLTSVIFLWLLAVKYPHDTSLKSATAIGLVFALGALCKGSALLCNTAALAVYLLVQNGVRDVFAPRVLLRLGVCMIIVIALAGPWYYRNHALYGQWQPVPHGYTTGALPRPEAGILVMMMHENFPHVLIYCLWGIFYSIWAQKDWVPEVMRYGVYIALALFCLGAVIGNFLKQGGGEAETEEEAQQRKIATRSSYAALIFTWFSCLFIALFVHFGQAEGGRYLIPAFTGAAIFLARGWGGLIGSARLNQLTFAWLVAFFALNAICVYWLVSYLNPLHGSNG